MRQKVTEKLEAIKLRKQGKSVNEIAALLNVSKGSVSPWVRNVPLSKASEKILLKKISAGQLAGGKSRHMQTVNAEKRHYDKAMNQYAGTQLSLNQQLLICALIYWCEGAKNTNRIDFTNADPDLVKLFLKFFRASFATDALKFRVTLQIHKYHNATRQINFWSQITEIPKKHFTKPYLKQHTGIQTRENYQGCASIRYHDADIARQLLAVAKAAFHTF
jgi:hypothetical protein